jgi:HEAT repeat protein
MGPPNLIDELREQLLSRIDPKAWSTAERDLERLKRLQVGSFNAALAIATDSARLVEDRSLAIWCLGQVGDTRTAPALVDLLELESSDAVIWETCKAIATSAASSDRPALSSRIEAILDSCPEDGKRAAFVFALGLLGQESAIPALSRVLHTSAASAQLREQAAEALGNLASQTAARALLEGLEEFPITLTTATVRALGAAADSCQVKQIEELVSAAELLLAEARTALELAKGRDSSG